MLLLGRLMVIKRGLTSLIHEMMPFLVVLNHTIHSTPVRKASKITVVDEEICLEFAREVRIVLHRLFRIVAVYSIELQTTFLAQTTR